MATFIDQITGLTGSISASNTEVGTFLSDGAKDVINKISLTRPDELGKFAKTSTDNADDGISINGKIISVVREHDSSTILRPCGLINQVDRYEASDSTSLKYRSKYNPGYYMLNGKVHTVPASASSNNAAIVEHISFPTVAHDDTSIGIYGKKKTGVTVTKANPAVFTKSSHSFTTGDTVKLYDFSEMTELNGITSQVINIDGNTFRLEGIDSSNYGSAESTGGTVEKLNESFPDDYEYLVVYYASIQVLNKRLAEFSISIPSVPVFGGFTNVTESIPTWNAPSLVMPVAPADVDIDFTSVPSAPSFTKQIFSAPSLENIGDLSLPNPPEVPVFSSNSVDISSLTAPAYTGPVVAPDFTQVSTYIDTDEDTELSGAKLQQIQSQIAEYQANISNALNTFNKDNAKYQADIQSAMKNQDLQEGHDNRILQTYQADLSKYQAEVNSNVQLWQQEEWTQKFTKYQTDYQNLLQEYSANIQNEQAKVSNDLSVYQQEIGKATNKFSAETGYDVSKYQSEVNANLQKFSSEIQAETARHQGELAQYTNELSVVSEKNNRVLQEFSTNLQRYTSEVNSEIQSKSTDYKWLADRLNLLKVQYDQALALQQPRQEGE